MTFDPKAQVDDTDWAILDALQADGRLPFSELGRRVALSPPAVAERVRRLEGTGVIQGYRAVVDPTVLGAGIEALVRVRVPNSSSARFSQAVLERPEILQCDHVTGEDCMVVRVRTSSMARLEGLVGAIGAFGPTTTSLVFSSEVRDRPIGRAVIEPDV
ncbi:Lrp/AsnC family transcriptional regulator [soil metagenome]